MLGGEGNLCVYVKVGGGVGEARYKFGGGGVVVGKDDIYRKGCQEARSCLVVGGDTLSWG